ncbi:MAG: hypothetical protein RL007_543 [Bacteroidota bacterium]|jgi:hypothetical protein
MVRRATHNRSTDSERKLKGFALLDIDTLLYGPLELRTSDSRTNEFEVLSRVFQNNLRNYLEHKTRPQREWCVTRLLKECNLRSAAENVNPDELVFLKQLENVLESAMLK